MRKRQLLLGGKLVDGDPRTIRSPFSGEPVSEVHFGRLEHVEEAVSIASHAVPMLAGTPPHRRAAILENMVHMIKERAEELAAAIRDEAAKPMKFAVGEAHRCAGTFHNAAEECKRLADGEGIGIDSDPAGEGRHGIVRHFPIGPIAGISPFNFPLNLTAHKLAPAIAAGCPAIIKPASQTPSAALLLGEIALDAGLPPEALSILPAPRRVADRLVEEERLKLVSFTGSPEVGWDLKGRAGKKKVVLELGGNAAAIVGQDADLDWAVLRLVAGSFAFAGQVCISVQRIFVHRSRYDEFITRFVERTRDKVQVSPPEDREALMSSMIDEHNAARLMSWIAEARDDGAEILCGNERDGTRVSPTVLINADPAAKVSAQEAFGPVVVISAFDDWNQAVSMVNDSRYGLQAGVFTNDVRAIWQCFSQIEVGGVIHNDYPTFRVDMMPYGGVKDSGFGREGLRWSLKEMTEPRLLVLWPR